jgi:7-cyano-7-deazaguanine synthase
VELEAARRVGEQLGVAHHTVLAIDLRAFGGSALTDAIDVPKDRPLEAMGEGVPATYVPARNTIFLAFALAYAETLGATDIFIGAHAIDYSGSPDCRPEFLAAFQHMARLGTRLGSEGAPLTIHAPLLALTKAEIVRRGMALGVDFAITRSCYDPAPDGTACGRCDACQLRLKGFRDAGLEDPAPYAQRPDGVAP